MSDNGQSAENLEPHGKKVPDPEGEKESREPIPIVKPELKDAREVWD